MKSHRRGRARALLGATALAWCAGAALLSWAGAPAWSAAREPGPAPLDALVVLVAAVGALAVLSWLAFGLALTVLAMAFGHRQGLPRRRRGMAPELGSTGWLGRLAEAITPAVLRRTAAAALGIAAASGTASLPAYAVTAPPPGTASAVVVTTVSTAPVALDRPTSAAADADELTAPAQTAHISDSVSGWTPDRPAAVPAPRTGDDGLGLVTATPGTGRAVEEGVTVRAGDSLWSLTARYLGPDACAAEIARTWPRWWDHNREVVGPDPHLLLPGQVLLPPDLPRHQENR